MDKHASLQTRKHGNANMPGHPWKHPQAPPLILNKQTEAEVGEPAVSVQEEDKGRSPSNRIYRAAMQKVNTFVPAVLTHTHTLTHAHTF